MTRMWNDGPGFESFLDHEGAPEVARRHICSFGGNSGAKQETTQETKLPEWVDQASRSNYNQAQDVSKNLMKPYEGQRVADLTPGMQSNIAAAQGNIGATNPGFQQAQQGTSNFLNFSAPQVQAGQLSQTDLNPYMNPWTQSVTNYGLQALDMQRQQALNQTGAQAQQAKAFGGSRQGVQEGVTNAAASMSAGKLASDLQSQNFLQAQGAASTDIGRRYAADVANQGAAVSSADVGLRAANQLGSLTSQGQTSFLSGLDSAMGYQTVQQQQQQAQLDAARGLYGEQKQHPLDQLNILQGALTNSPYGKTVVGTQPGPTDNTGMQVAGTGIALAGTVAAFM